MYELKGSQPKMFCETGYKIVKVVVCDSVTHACGFQQTCVERTSTDPLIDLLYIVLIPVAFIMLASSWMNVARKFR